MPIDDSFKKPGAIPFKWEIRPGVPKVHQPKQMPPSNDQHRSFSLQEKQTKQSSNLGLSLPSSPQKLTPPPVGNSYFQALISEPQTRSFASAPRTRSNHHRFERSVFSKPETVSQGCFSAPMLMRKPGKKASRKSKPGLQPKPVPVYNADLEILSRRWSVSRSKSPSPFFDSPLSSSFSSNLSSPRQVSDVEWVAFGLF